MKRATATEETCTTDKSNSPDKLPKIVQADEEQTSLASTQLRLDKLPADVLLTIFKMVLPKDASEDHYFTSEDFHAIWGSIAPVCSRFYSLCDQLSMFKYICYNKEFTSAKFESFGSFLTKISAKTGQPRVSVTQKMIIDPKLPQFERSPLGYNASELVIYNREQKMAKLGEVIRDYKENFTLTNPAVHALFSAAQELWCLKLSWSGHTRADIGPPYNDGMSIVSSFFESFPAAVVEHHGASSSVVTKRAFPSLKAMELDVNTSYLPQNSPADIELTFWEAIPNPAGLKCLSHIDEEQNWLKQLGNCGNRLRKLYLGLPWGNVSDYGMKIRESFPELESLEVFFDSAFPTAAGVNFFLGGLCFDGEPSVEMTGPRFGTTIKHLTMDHISENAMEYIEDLRSLETLTIVNPRCQDDDDDDDEDVDDEKLAENEEFTDMIGNRVPNLKVLWGSKPKIFVVNNDDSDDEDDDDGFFY